MWRYIFWRDRWRLGAGWLIACIVGLLPFFFEIPRPYLILQACILTPWLVLGRTSRDLRAGMADANFSLGGQKFWWMSLVPASGVAVFAAMLVSRGDISVALLVSVALLILILISAVCDRLCRDGGVAWLYIFALIFALLLVGSVVQAAPLQEPVGDGSALSVLYENQRVIENRVSIGPPDALPEGRELKGYEKARFVVQCQGPELPELVLNDGGKSVPIKNMPIAFENGAPALWLSNATRGRGALEALVRSVEPDIRLEHRTIDSVPESFGALRFAPMILIDASEFGLLTPGAQAALEGAVYSGSLLVVAAGYEGGQLAPWIDLELQKIGRPGPALFHALPRVSGRREWKLGPSFHNLIMADGLPLAAEMRLGLGAVRVVAVSLAELDRGVLADALFKLETSDLETALDWIKAVPLPAVHRKLFAWKVWALCISFVALMLAFRFIRKVKIKLCLSGGLLLWIILALFVSPSVGLVNREVRRAACVPSSTENQICFGSVDVTLARGGGVSLPMESELAIEDASPGACTVVGGSSPVLALQGEPGATVRLTFFALSKSAVLSTFMPEHIETFARKASLPSSPRVLGEE